MIQVSSRAILTIRRKLDCTEPDQAAEIVKRHTDAAAHQVALELKRLDAGYEVDLSVDCRLAYVVD